MDQEQTALIKRWIQAFSEPPPLVDVELMRAVLAEHEGQSREQAP